MPLGAYIQVGECRFERDTCDWYNDTTQDKSSMSWRMATVSRRPANLPDKTFGAPGNSSSEESIELQPRYIKVFLSAFKV
jgi:hypothetical protein